MSPDIQFLGLRFEGPLQAWGGDSQYSLRNSGLMPTRSAIAGMICAALGFERGSRQEKEFLIDFESLRMKSIAIPRKIEHKTADASSIKMLSVRRLVDFHTIQKTITAEGDIKDCHITHRQYLTDAAFGIVLSGKPKLLSRIATALSDPVWGVWLGRKSCIPSSPVFAGIRSSLEECLKLLIIDKPLDYFTRQEEVETFAEGTDSISDVPVSFASTGRQFSRRRVRTVRGKI